MSRVGPTLHRSRDLHAAQRGIVKVDYRRGVAQPGSAPQWGCGGREFESRRPDHNQYPRMENSGTEFE